eukprot:scaffold138181_cov190-Phaeocystis_antarctica.AAC.1
MRRERGETDPESRTRSSAAAAQRVLRRVGHWGQARDRKGGGSRVGCGVGPAVCPAGGGLEAAVCMGQRPEEVDDAGCVRVLAAARGLSGATSTLAAAGGALTGWGRGHWGPADCEGVVDGCAPKPE